MPENMKRKKNKKEKCTGIEQEHAYHTLNPITFLKYRIWIYT